MAVANEKHTQFLKRVPERVHIAPRHPRRGQHELGLLDLAFAEKFVCYTLFFTYTVEREDLENALREWTDEYFEFVARIAPHPTQKFQLEINQDAWLYLIEQHSHLASHNAFQTQARTQMEVEGFPSYLELPFFLEAIDLNDMLLGTEPLMKVKLTHYADGACSVGFTCANAIADHQRVLSAIADLGRIMRNPEIAVPTRDHDRDCLWPDSLIQNSNLQKYFLPLSTYKRTFRSDYRISKFEAMNFSSGDVSVEMLFFPNEVIDGLVAKLNRVLNDDLKITRMQVLTALVWMLRCEMEVDQEGDLERLLVNKRCMMMIDLLDKPHTSAIPDSFFGNAIIPPIIEYKQKNKSLADSGLLHTLLNACLTIRRAWNEKQSELSVTERIEGIHRAVHDTEHVIAFPLKLKSCSWYFTVEGPEAYDFGQGPPAHLHATLPLPLFHYTNLLYPEIHGDGFYASLVVVSSHRPIFFNSRVIHECAEGVQYVFGCQDPDSMPMEPMQLW